MNPQEVKDKTRGFLGKFIRNVELGEDDDLFAQGFVNSLFAMQLVLFVEKEFGVSVGNDDLDFQNFKSINAISDFILKKIPSD